MAQFRKPSTRILTGDKELDAKLVHLKTGVANKYVRRGFTKALRVIVKGMKAKVPSQYKDAKKALGSRFDKKGGIGRDEVRAKAGAGVGKAYKAVPKGSRPNGRLGIGGRNLLWFIRGTQERQTKSGKSSGRMPAILPDIVKDGFNSTSSQAMSIIRTEILTGIEAEARK